MYRKWVKISLVVVYLVIIAGAMVRMTGSGMGCPDWPKCFGYYIPPTDSSELDWQADRNYKKGQVIIVDETLRVATEDFTSDHSFNPSNWEQYTRHDYAVFNTWHTWIEYINRLTGALSGLAILIMAIVSVGRWNVDRRITLLSWLTVFLIGFQAWLGATVVYSVLAPIKITIHMVMALVIVALLIYLLHISRSGRTEHATPGVFKSLLVFSIFLTLVQVVLGTQVRQLVDENVATLGYDDRSLWLQHPDFVFYFHRTFSVLVLGVNFILYYLNKSRQLGYSLINWIILLLILEVATGIAMFYFDFPVLSQPAHLVLATVLFGIQFYLLLVVFRRKSTI